MFVSMSLFKQQVVIDSQLMNKTNQHMRSVKHFPSTIDEDTEIKDQNARLKRLLKQVTAQRNITIKQCTQLSSKIDHLEQELLLNGKKHREQAQRNSNEGYRIQELHFLNKELNGEIQQLRSENRDLLEKYKRTTNVIEKKYEQLERGTFKKIEQAMKRVKKSVMYLNTLSAKEIEKSKFSIVQNLEKSLELLKGKGIGQTYEEQVQQLMSPISNIKEELIKKDKELRATKVMLEEIQESYNREEKLNKNILPQYKNSIQELQKNLSISRSQVAELQVERLENRRKYQIKVKQLEEENRQLVTAFTKLKLQRKIYSDRIKQIEGEAEEEKERLMDQNQMLKALYKTKPNDLKNSSVNSSHITNKQPVKQSFARSRQSSQSRLTSSRHSVSHKYSEPDSSLMSSVSQSQNALKNQIEQIDNQIREMQSNMEREFYAYKH